MGNPTCFNIRVYGICIQNHQLLVSDEYVMDMYMTKFPGGGLEYGEGPIECLKRECREEMELDVNVTQHFYTTDFFQPTRFFKNTQLISIYYRFEIPDNKQIRTSKEKFDFEKEKNGSQSFRWISISELTPEEMTFPIDQKVVELLKRNF
jgi:8-oxo-dGTP pyrophosphatase MutT (NUDIX family)